VEAWLNVLSPPTASFMESVSFACSCSKSRSIVKASPEWMNEQWPYYCIAVWHEVQIVCFKPHGLKQFAKFKYHHHTESAHLWKSHKCIKLHTPFNLLSLNETHRGLCAYIFRTFLGNKTKLCARFIYFCKMHLYLYFLSGSHFTPALLVVLSTLFCHAQSIFHDVRSMIWPQYMQVCK